MVRFKWKGVAVLLLVGTACGPPTIVEGPGAVDVARPRQTLQLHVRARDAASTELLAYTWTQEPPLPEGRFSSTSERAPTWTAPDVSQPATFTLRVTVVDRLGQSTQGAVSVQVRPADASGDNRPPVVVQVPIATPADARAGDTLTLAVAARDEEGDALTYAWRQLSPPLQGTFVSDVGAASVSWRAPEVAAATDFRFEVTISDGHGPPVRQAVTVPVRVPRYAQDIQPLFDALCTRCHGPAGQLSLAAGEGHAALVGVAAHAGKCKTLMVRVQPGAPEGSALMLRLEGEECGIRMPMDAPRYFDENPGELARLRSWIRGGAAND
ncbi:Ig-like domain-containing protein [Myxococcaceae bacterium GXIMD 01537]